MENELESINFGGLNQLFFKFAPFLWVRNHILFLYYNRYIAITYFYSLLHFLGMLKTYMGLNEVQEAFGVLLIGSSVVVVPHHTVNVLVNQPLDAGRTGKDEDGPGQTEDQRHYDTAEILQKGNKENRKRGKMIKEIGMYITLNINTTLYNIHNISDFTPLCYISIIHTSCTLFSRSYDIIELIFWGCIDFQD